MPACPHPRALDLAEGLPCPWPRCPEGTARDVVELHRRDVVTYRDVGESVGLGLIRVRASQEERPGVPFRRYRTADGWEWRQVRP